MIYILLYNKIKERLEQIPAIKSVDWFNQQYQNTEKDNAEPYPAVYVEFSDPTNWKTAGQKMQSATMRVELHVVVHDLKTVPNSCLELMQTVFKKLYHHVVFDGDNQITTELDRDFTELPKRFKNLKVAKIGFMFECFDISGMDETVLTTTGFNITRTIS